MKRKILLVTLSLMLVLTACNKKVNIDETKKETESKVETETKKETEKETKQETKKETEKETKQETKKETKKETETKVEKVDLVQTRWFNELPEKYEESKMLEIVRLESLQRGHRRLVERGYEYNPVTIGDEVDSIGLFPRYEKSKVSVYSLNVDEAGNTSRNELVAKIDSAGQESLITLLTSIGGENPLFEVEVEFNGETYSTTVNLNSEKIVSDNFIFTDLKIQ